MSQTFHKLRVAEKIHETEDAVSLLFDLSSELKELFAFKSGQYITIKCDPAGEEIRRSYSICCAPNEGSLKVNVKKIKGGKMSTWVVDQLKAGDQVDVGIPEGNFIADFDPAKRRNHYFIAAGSGITPVMSLIKDGLEAEPMSTFVLLYGNKNEENIIFHDELLGLQERYGEQFKLFQTLSQKKSGAKLLSFLSKNKDSWQGWKGRIDTKKMEAVLDEITPSKVENHFYLCGPGELITTMQKWLKEQSFPGAKIHKEYFVNPDQSTGQVLTTQATKLTFKNLHGADGELEVPANKTLLEALMDAGFDPPYSCMNGVCSSCVAKLVKGNVEMDTCLALEDDEIAAGYILTCQSHALTPEIELQYEG
jgi:ring-1,2-phenylacetyl-CoA epoxidase subunit PaaE